jgi:hypothetical protein
LGRGAFAAGLIALNCITPAVPGAFGASVEFQGELNYDTFKRASDKGVGIRITQSPGGTGAAAMVLGRAKGLVIDGRCQSACAWAFVQNQSACFTKRASFDFHAAHDPGTGRRLTAATDYWLSTVGPELRARLSGLRTSSNLIRVSAREMAGYYGSRQCGAGGRRAEITVPAQPRVGALRSTASDAAARITTASIALPTAWSAADGQAGVAALRTARSDSGVIVATLIASDQTAPAEAPAQTETVANLISRLMPSLSSGVPAEISAAWPEAAYTLADGIVSSVEPSATLLAAHTDATAISGG